MSARIAFMRHGHTTWNRAHRIQGRTDIPLDDEAREGLKKLAFPKPWNLATLWSSNLHRAIESAELVGGSARVSDALLEMNWGDWEGLHGAELRAEPGSGFRDIENWGWDYTPPGGESPRDISNRLIPWMKTLEADHVCVTHIGVMRVALATAYGWNFEGPCPFAIKRNRLYVIEIDAEIWTPWEEPVRLIAR